MGTLWVTTAAVAEATVITAAAVTGDVATFEAWQLFAQAHAAAFVVLGVAIAVIAGNEARSTHATTPPLASWIGAVAGVVAAVGIALSGPVWLASSIVMSLWTLWFSVSLARSDGATRTPAPIKNAILFDALTRDYRNVLPGIDLPMLVCAGADEKRGTVAAVKHVADLVPDARFERFEDSSHCPTIEESERFNRVLGRFVDSL